LWDVCAQRRICALGDECASTDPHHFLTHQHTILNLDEKVQWINYNNTHSSTIHVSGVSTSEVVDEEVELLTQAKRSSSVSDVEKEEDDDDDDDGDEDTSELEDKEREAKEREAEEKRQTERKREEEKKKKSESDKDKAKLPADSNAGSFEVQITIEKAPADDASDNAKAVSPAAEAEAAAAVPKLVLGLVPPPVPPKPAQLSPRQPMSPRRPIPAGTTHHVQIAEGSDPSQGSDLKRTLFDHALFAFNSRVRESSSERDRFVCAVH
jgi:hypothetical protein